MTITHDTDTDTTVRAAVIDELAWTPSIDSTFIIVAVHRGAVTLSGEVASYPEKRHAEKAALRVRGVTAVAEQITVRSVWGLADDALIQRAALEALEQAVDVPGGCVTVAVNHRAVTLTGSTPWQYQRAACVRAVSALRGVASVSNAIVVRPTLTPDGVHEAIAAAFVRSAQLEGDRVVVTAVGGDVTLEGQVHTWAERHEAEYAAWSAPGVTNVNNHIVIVH